MYECILLHYNKLDKSPATCYEKNKQLKDLLKEACETSCADLQLTDDDLYACLCSF